MRKYEDTHFFSLLLGNMRKSFLRSFILLFSSMMRGSLHKCEYIRRVRSIFCRFTRLSHCMGRRNKRTSYENCTKIPEKQRIRPCIILLYKETAFPASYLLKAINYGFPVRDTEILIV